MGSTRPLPTQRARGVAGRPARPAGCGPSRRCASPAGSRGSVWTPTTGRSPTRSGWPRPPAPDKGATGARRRSPGAQPLRPPRRLTLLHLDGPNRLPSEARLSPPGGRAILAGWAKSDPGRHRRQLRPSLRGRPDRPCPPQAKRPGGRPAGGRRPRRRPGGRRRPRGRSARASPALRATDQVADGWSPSRSLPEPRDHPGPANSVEEQLDKPSIVLVEVDDDTTRHATDHTVNAIRLNWETTRFPAPCCCPPVGGLRDACSAAVRLSPSGTGSVVAGQALVSGRQTRVDRPTARRVQHSSHGGTRPRVSNLTRRAMSVAGSPSDSCALPSLIPLSREARGARGEG